MRSKLLSIHLIFLLTLVLFTGPAQNTLALEGPESLAYSYPPDPTADINWSAQFNGVADIQAAFNNARTVENGQLGTSVPMLTLPDQATWDGMSDDDKALWLINRERIDRNLVPLQGVEPNVDSVAEYYADYLLANDAWGHSEDGRSPWERLDDNPAIGACHDFLAISENLAVFVTSGSNIPLPIERSIYMWMYDDAGSSWGHRHAILWYPYTDNSGAPGSEGFLGIGRANGGPYQGPFSQVWNFAEIIVMNVFDPCTAWSGTDTTAPTVASITLAGPNPTNAAVVSFTVTFSESVTGVDAADFNLNVSGVSGVSISGVTGSGASRTVSVNTGTNNGSIQLNLVDNDSILDFAGNPLGGPGAGNGNFSGGTYEVIRTVFVDVGPTHVFWKHIEAFYNAGITTGCSTSPMLYCPDESVTRGQMAVFIERALGNFSPAPSPSGMFTDVLSDNPFKLFIEEFYNDGITTGCSTSPLMYCPDQPVTRGQMAVFIVRAFGIPLP